MSMIPEISKHRREIEELCRTHHVRRLELFGSATGGQELAAESDLDFLVDLQDLPDDGAYADAYFGLLEGLQRLFARPIDLVVARAIRNPYFRRSVERTKELVYAA